METFDVLIIGTGVTESIVAAYVVTNAKKTNAQPAH